MAGFMEQKLSKLNGLYKVDFITPALRGFGVVIFEQGRARGGDSIVAYNGTYTETGSDIEIQLEAFRHSHKNDLVPIFGNEHVTMTVNAKLLTKERIVGTASCVDAPDIPMKVVFTKLRD